MMYVQENIDLGRIRTCNLLIRSQTRYPLRHETMCSHSSHYLVNNKIYPTQWKNNIEKIEDDTYYFE